MVERVQVPAKRPPGRPKGAIAKPRVYPTLRGEPLALRVKYETTPLEQQLKLINTPFPEYKDWDDGIKEKPKEIRNRRGEIVETIPPDPNIRRRRYLAAKQAYENRQDNAAKSAAPFMHYRLAAIELTGKEAEPRKRQVDLSRLNGTELDLLEKLMRKADLNAEITLDQHQYRTINNGDEDDGQRT